MLRMPIKYTDFNGVDQVEDHYFNLSKPELIKMQISGPDNDFSAQLQKIAKSRKGKEIMDTFEFFIKASYGVRSEDGKKFRKTAEFEGGPTPYDEFIQTGAYDAFFMELVTDAGAGARFINGLMPPDLVEQVQNDPTLSEQQKQIADDMAAAGATLSANAGETARERSEASLQGFRKKAIHEGYDIQDVPTQPSTPVTAPKSLDQMSAQELEEELARRKASTS